MWKWDLLCRLLRRLFPAPDKRRRHLERMLERLHRELDSVADTWHVSQPKVKLPQPPDTGTLPTRIQPAVVVQGPLLLDDDFTYHTLRYYRATFPGSPLILSTWVGEDPVTLDRLRDEGVHVVLSQRGSCPGPANLNLQVRSTRAGLAAARKLGAEYALKTRCDTRLYALNIGDFLGALLEQFPPAAGLAMRGRIIALEMATRLYIPLHLSDILQFGHIDDLQAYWSIDELGPDVRMECPQTFVDFCGDAIPEVILCQQFMERLGCDSHRTLDNWWRALAEMFLVVDRASLGFFWPKYNYGTDHVQTEDNQQRNLALCSFREWLQLAVWHKQPWLTMDDLHDHQVNQQLAKCVEG